REVEKLLSLTRQQVGEKEFSLRFLRFAGTFTPVSVKRYLEDALTFSSRLMQEDFDTAVKSLIRYESRRLRHNSFDRKLSFCVLRYDPRTSPPGSGFGIWVAIGRWSRILFRANQRG
ncbi:MAG: hypothetical protein ABL984_19690, partial [Pyrinomonadaceae bacterium]